MKKAKRLRWVDLARGFAMLLVIVGHEKTGFLKFLIFSFHMPIFFLLSGYTSHKRNSIIEIKRTGKSLIKRLLIPAFLTISVVNIEWLLLGKQNIVKTIYYIFDGFLWGSASGGPAHHPTIGFMWFLIVFFWSKLIYELFSLYIDAKGIVVIFGILSLIIMQTQSLWFLPQSFDLVPLSIFFMVIGNIINKEELVRKSNNLTLLFLVFMWAILLQLGNWIDMGERFYYGGMWCVVTACIASLCIMILSKSLVELKLMVPVIYIGRHTLLLLCVHYMDLYDLLIKPHNHLVGSSNMIFRLIEDLSIFFIIVSTQHIFHRSKKNAKN